MTKKQILWGISILIFIACWAVWLILGFTACSSFGGFWQKSSTKWVQFIIFGVMGLDVLATVYVAICAHFNKKKEK